MNHLDDADRQAEMSRVMDNAYRQAIDSIREVKTLNLN